MLAAILALGAWAGSATAQTTGVQLGPLPAELQQILLDGETDPKFTYPTAITQGIIPKFIHSHNDYWRRVPFWSALAAGAISIEADVWLYNDTLYVGHRQSTLSAVRTFDTLYVQPLLHALLRQNPVNAFVTHGPTKNGVYDYSANQTLHLIVDVKSDGHATWPHVVRALQPLRDHGFLTTVSGTNVTTGPVTVIGTGNTPLGLVQGSRERDYFIDAPLDQLNSTLSNITSDVAPLATARFPEQFGEVRLPYLNSTQSALLKQQVQTAHAKGIKVRYLSAPAWPIGTRNAIWRTFVDNGVDLLNADDLEAAVEFWQARG